METPIDFEKVTDRVKAAYLLGAPYERELEEAPEMARRQAERIAADVVSQGGSISRRGVMTLDSQAVALIAYLQRLGVDAFATPPAEAAQQTEDAPPAEGVDAAAPDAAAAPDTLDSAGAPDAAPQDETTEEGEE